MLPSANVPTAEKYTSACKEITALAGLIANEIGGEASTNTDELPVTPAKVALTSAAPGDRAVISPAALTFAMSEADDDQLTTLLITWVLPSLKVPMAVQERVVAGASTEAAGVIEIELRVAELTFNAVELEVPSKVAKIFVVPGATAMKSLPDRTFATLGFVDNQVASRVIICVLLSLNKPSAANANLVPSAMLGAAGVTEMETIVAFVMSNETVAPIDPSMAVIRVVPGVRPRARPLLSIVATSASVEVHLTCLVTL